VRACVCVCTCVSFSVFMSVRERACVPVACVPVCACVRACVRACVSEGVYMHTCVRACHGEDLRYLWLGPRRVRRACVCRFARVGRRCHVELPYGQRAVGWANWAHDSDRRRRRHLRHRRL
jgi:hypothetical protein